MTDLVDEDNARHDLRDALRDVARDDFVDLATQLLRHLRTACAYKRAHDAHDILPTFQRDGQRPTILANENSRTLRTRVGRVQIAQRDVLHELLALVHVALRERDVRLALEVVRARVRVRPADPLPERASASLARAQAGH